jgi:hypothetical protein
MRFSEMCEILEQVRYWHGLVAKRFEELAGQEHVGARAKLMLDYMASRHEVFAHGVEQFMTECPSVERGSWAKHAGHEEVLMALLARLEKDRVSLSEAEDAGMAIGRFFVDLFSDLEAKGDSRQVREVFASLRAGAQKELTKLSRNVNLLLDF